MPRAARVIAENGIYHVVNRGNGRAVVFRKPADFDVFVHLIGEAKARYPVKVIAYCLMSNHFHLLLQPESGEALSQWMQWLMTSHVRRYHRHYHSSGHVWQGRFKSFVIEEDAHLLTALRYVEGNPVRAGMVASAREWPWSSHRENLGEMARGVTDEAPIALPSGWAGFVDTPLTDRELRGLGQGLAPCKGACPVAVGAGQATLQRDAKQPVPVASP